MYGYEWTAEYGIFRLTIDAKIQKEIRPVFHEELDFLGWINIGTIPKIPIILYCGLKVFAVM